MSDDTEEIYRLIDSWTVAARKGDLATILDLMSEEVVFLQPGQKAMCGREAFAKNFQASIERFRIDTKSDIKDIEVSGTLAYCWNHLSVSMTPHNGEPRISRAGNVLSVLRKEADGRWRIFRDANLLA
ncbi:MAG: SgcJ/EcaC family oxidoreductase [Prosthecobacter sp.]|nr:SgcJ/EcaC family oxidoreductase [Prosthecobacter sp.]